MKMDKPTKKINQNSVNTETVVIPSVNEEPLSIGNIGLWYYRTFFCKYFEYEKDTNPEKEKLADWLKKTCKPLLEANFTDYPVSIELSTTLPCYLMENASKLTTIYPGLICGIGYEHELGFENEFKLGFSFDHTTGLPYIPGSSVKGTLRSAFRHYDYMKSIFENWKNGSTECPAELKDNIDEICKNLAFTDWEKLEKKIFDGIDYVKDKKIKTEIKLSTYKRDLFFDAFITETSTDNKGLFLADDYITCHQNSKHPEMSPFTNPNPVRFLKVRSDVTFTFGFQLQDTVMEDGLVFSKIMKRELFKQILLDLGIGAKTNVGYGQFKDFVDKEVVVTESTQQTA